MVAEYDGRHGEFDAFEFFGAVVHGVQDESVDVLEPRAVEEGAFAFGAAGAFDLHDESVFLGGGDGGFREFGEVGDGEARYREADDSAAS